MVKVLKENKYYEACDGSRLVMTGKEITELMKIKELAKEIAKLTKTEKCNIVSLFDFVKGMM